MVVCIVTVYDSINSGSFWQAYALGHTLKSMGQEVYYYKRYKKGASSSTSKQLKIFTKRLLKGRFADARDYLTIIRQFKKEASAFKIIDSGDPEFKKVDCFILGSDTIWNLDSQYFKNAKSIFWGDVFKGRRVFSYAGSVANTKPEKFTPAGEFADSVNSWTGIAVRDEYTKSVLSRFTDREITRVCDPTLLMDKAGYGSVCKAKQGKYIFIYLFEPLSKAQKDALRGFADSHGLKIIVGTARRVLDNADEYIVNSPRVFMEYMLGAEYVISDTFHGTIFSTNFNKKLAVIDRGKNKVNEYLSDIGLEDRLVTADKTLDDVLGKPVDYTEANKKIKAIRESSLAYIKGHLS